MRLFQGNQLFDESSSIRYGPDECAVLSVIALDCELEEDV